MSGDFHIVAAFLAIGGGEGHAAGLRTLLAEQCHKVTLWADRATPFVSRYGARLIQPYAGQLPRGGTLLIVGTYVKLGTWLAYSRPRRAVLICNYASPDLLFSMLEQLKQAGVPQVDIVYVSTAMRDAMGLPGHVCPPLVDLQRFVPATTGHGDTPLRLGRLSRDEPFKHHPEDPSLYRLLAWHGWQVRILGGTCLSKACGTVTGIELLSVGTEDASEFLHSLDVFFYRTGPGWAEPSGRVILEAMACGLPVVAHRNGGYTDWVRDGENGFLFETQEEAWNALCRLQAEPALRLAMGKRARLDAERYAGPDALAAYAKWLLEGHGYD